MARSRLIRPEFWDDEKLANVSRESRLFFIGLWKCSDDYGVTRGNEVWLKNQILPYDDLKIAQVSKWLHELTSIGAIAKFVHNGEKYYYIKNFLKHQKVDHPSKIRNPEPPENFPETLASDSRDIRDETETETETETIFMSGKPDVGPPDSQIPKRKYTTEAKEVLEFLNLKTGRNYQPVDANLNLIEARLKTASVQDCKSIIAKKCREWISNEKMAQYLRPATLFNATKFAQYQGELLKEGVR